MMLTVNHAKNQANILKKYLQQNNVGISHSSCLNAIALMYQYPNWNTMFAMLGDERSEKHIQPLLPVQRSDLISKGKNQAKTLKQYLKQANLEILDSTCLDVIALMNGYSSWSAMETGIILFSDPGSDEFYEIFRIDKHPYCKPAKHYWQGIFEKNRMWLDSNFDSQLREDAYSRLWELTLIEFLSGYKSQGLTLIQMFGKKISKPDFYFSLLDSKFYLEAVCASPSNVAALNEPFVNLKARNTPVAENMERFCQAVHSKAHCKYHGENGKTGYKKYMDQDSGLILAVSVAKIPFQNQTRDFNNELRCLFGMSPLKFQIIRDSAGKGSMGNPHRTEQKNFDKVTKKTNETAPIKMDYFSNEEYSHISAVLISYTEMVFFQGFDQYFPISWQYCQNDYVLVHNTYAKVKIPVGFFNVLREVTAEVTDGGLEIKIMDKTQGH